MSTERVVDVSLRVPPHSTEAEQSVLGALLLDNRAWSVAIETGLQSAHFYDHGHRLIFDAVARLLADGQPVDVVTASMQLEGEVSDFGGLPYLNSLAQSVPSAANIRRYAAIVVERAVLRAVIAEADRLATRAFGVNADPAALLDDARIAIARIQEQAKGSRSSRLPVLSGTQLVESAQAMRWLVKGAIPQQSMGVLFGASGTFKSFLALDCMCHVAHGLPWLGRRTARGAGLWIAAEGGRGIGYRLAAWHRARRLPVSDNIVGIPASIDLGTDAWRVVEAVQASVSLTPAIVVVDTLSQTYTAGADENSAADMAAYIRELGTRFRDLWGCAVLVIHHSGHSATNRPRGSSVIQPNTDFLFGCYRDEKEMLATLTCEHLKDGDRFDDATFRLLKVELGDDEHGERIVHLAARHLSSVEEVDEAMAEEKQSGRGGKNQELLGLVQNGMREQDLRLAFYATCEGMKTESRRQAYYRALAWAKTSGLLDVSEGYVIALRRG